MQYPCYIILPLAWPYCRSLSNLHWLSCSVRKTVKNITILSHIHKHPQENHLYEDNNNGNNSLRTSPNPWLDQILLLPSLQNEMHTLLLFSSCFPLSNTFILRFFSCNKRLSSPPTLHLASSATQYAIFL